MRFTINLATKTILNYRRVDRACTIAVVALGILLAGNIGLYSWNLGEMRRLDAETTEVKHRLARPLPPIPEKDQAGILANITFYNDIIKRKTYGWLAFLEKLEAATPDGISVTRLLPDRAKGSLAIEGWARDFKAVEAYLAMLEDSKTFYDVLLLSHKKEALWEQAKGVRFSISCRVKEQ
ncbi:MAG: PilN domain-containing protein [Geobacteraceae bacterium]|nr:PilN domain-containing protein [Geobacteraceae bacterium]